MAFQHGFISFKWGPRFYLQKHQRWQNVACHLGKTTHLKHTSIIVQPKRLLRVFNPPSLCPQCACDYDFVIVLDASLVCVLVRILVSCPPASHMGSKKKSIISGTSSCCMGSKKKLVSVLFLLLPRIVGQWITLKYVGILSVLCEIKYCFFELWWMDWVTQISVTNTLKTFPEWPYK